MAARPIPAAARVLAPIGLAFALTASAQTAEPVARVLHPVPPLPSYDVATIKPEDAAGIAPNGMRILSGSTVRTYIGMAYSPAGGPLPPTQVIGGPEWLDKDKYIINGKPAADLELAMQKMKAVDRFQQDRAMRQSLLADRFHLKVHFEVREMPIYALEPAKGGLKIKAVAYPTSPAPDAPASSPAPSKRPLIPGAIQMGMGGASMVLWAHAISMTQLAGILSSLINQSGSSINLANTGDRPVVDQTGFAGYFDIEEMKWATLASATPSDSPPELPALDTALEETLGLRLVRTKGPVEVVVIDSIDRPSEN